LGGVYIPIYPPSLRPWWGQRHSAVVKKVVWLDLRSSIVQQMCYRARGAGHEGAGKLGRSKLGLGKLGFGKVGRWGGKLGRSTTSKSAWVKVDLLIRGVATGGYIGIYTPQSVYLKFFYVVVLSPWPIYTHPNQIPAGYASAANNVPVISYVLLSHCSINVSVWSNAQVANWLNTKCSFCK